MLDNTIDIQVFVMEKQVGTKTQWHVVLQYPDGHVEIIDQGYDTQEECAQAIQKYADDRRGQIVRMH